MALVDAAEQMAKRPLPVAVRFCAFGAEEFDFLGSRHYVLSLKERGELGQVVAMINLDAIGNRKEEKEGYHNFRVTDDTLRSVVEAAIDHFGESACAERRERDAVLDSFVVTRARRFDRDGRREPPGHRGESKSGGFRRSQSIGRWPGSRGRLDIFMSQQ